MQFTVSSEVSMRRLRSLWRSTVGKKAVMAGTGVILVGYIVTHVAANLLVFAGPRLINAYGALLHSTGALLWVARGILLAAFLLHVTAAVQLARRARAARPTEYRRHDAQAATAAARSIRWGGVALLVFLLVHTPQMTAGLWLPGFVHGDDYHNVVRVFRLWWTVPLYLVGTAALGLHLYHGTWSMWRSLGATPTNAHAATPGRRAPALVFALAVALGFAIIPLAVLAGVVAEEPARVVVEE